MTKRLTLLFPILAVFISLLAWKHPAWFNGFADLIIPLLMLIMFAMGLTLTLEDFKRVLDHKSAVVIGLVLQFTIMPLSAYVLSMAFTLPTELLVGMVLVGSASGGTASNVICFLAKANVALSITMTLMSTLVAVILLPVLSWLYLDAVVSIPLVGLFYSVLKIVLLPLTLGLLLNFLFSISINRISFMLPPITTGAIILVIAIIVSLNQPKLASISLLLSISVVLHNVIGLTSGYFLAKALGQSETNSRTIAIEVGMQNSGLAVALALKYFSPLAALPGALFSIWHNITGSVLAAYWRERQTN